jgi:ZIP family zinc transporter
MVEVVLWSLFAALGTSVGGLTIYLYKNPTRRALDLSVGFAAGVMIAATMFGLLPAAGQDMSVLWVSVWFILGMASIALADKYYPHQHWRHSDNSGYEHRHPRLPRRAWMLAGALTIHNIPEGLAVGAAFAYSGAELGIPLALAIALHNIPEGFAVAAPASDYPRRGRLALLAAATGMVEIPAIIIAYLLASSITYIIAPSLAFAAGAMIYVVFDELLPDTFRGGNERLVALAAGIGIISLLAVQDFVDLFL